MPTWVARTYAAASMILLFIKFLHLDSFQKNFKIMSIIAPGWLACWLAGLKKHHLKK
jgi:hypothetical protein